MNCSVARALEVIGEWWTLLILRDAFLGVTRFEEWTERLGIARNMLSTRLDTLIETGVMERKVYDEARDRADYVLTEKGRALWPVLVTIREWGNEWIFGRDHEPLGLQHRDCGEVTHPDMVCDKCGETAARALLPQRARSRLHRELAVPTEGKPLRWPS